MELNQASILTINGGSSSIKFSIYRVSEPFVLLLDGAIENIDAKDIKFSFTSDGSANKKEIQISADSYDGAIKELIDWLHTLPVIDSVAAIGHRIVHGMKHTKPEVITEELLQELRSFISYDPEHLPNEIKLVEVFQKQFSSLPQVACFDTAFHAAMPTVAKLLPIPRKYNVMGIHRYGFHGLSYAYLLEELDRIAGSEKANGKIIMAHLGNGASLAALKDGKSIDTSMGFTPASGLPMSTRTGDLDPGVASYLIASGNLTSKEFIHLVTHQSGLLGVSEISSDMQVLLKHEATDNRAAEAIELFCYQTKKWIGSFAAALEGLDTLIFSGGIGENAPEVRRRICNGLQFLGIEIDEVRNNKNAVIISTAESKVAVYVIKTDEQLMIARQVGTLLNISTKN